MGSKPKKTKSIAKNAFFNVLYRVVNMIFPLVTVIYVSHILLATGIGKVGTAQNIVNYFVLIAPLGIANYGTREIAKRRSSETETNRLFTELFLINFFSTLVCTIVYYVMVSTGGYFEKERKVGTSMYHCKRLLYL